MSQPDLQDFLQMTLNVLADTPVDEFEPTVHDLAQRRVIQIDAVPHGVLHSSVVHEKASEILAGGPHVFFAFRSEDASGRVIVGEVSGRQPSFLGFDVAGTQASVQRCGVPFGWGKPS
jgi:hypothetical protein